MDEMYSAMPGSPITYLAGDISAGQTTIAVVDDTALPDAPNICTIGYGEHIETIRYGAKSNGVLQDVTRGIEGTPRAWQSGTEVARFYTAYDHNAIIQTIMTHKAEKATQDNVHGLRSEQVYLGANSEGNNSYSSIAIGDQAKSNGPFHAISIGRRSNADGESTIAIGRESNATGGAAVAIGYGTEANGDSVTLGRFAAGLGERSIVIGRNASAEGNGSVAIGISAMSMNANEGVLGTDSSGASGWRTSSWIVPGSFTVQGTKNFEIPHPHPDKKDTHRIRHGAVESPTAGDTLYRYKITADKDNDLITIDLPDYFIHLNKDVQVWITGQGHFGNGYGKLNRETEQLEIHCQTEGEYNVLVIGTRNDDHQSVQDWNIKGVEREIGESWTGETYVFADDELISEEEF